MSLDGSADSGAREVARQLSKLCEWVPTVTAGDIPEPIMRRAATVLCDDIAAIVAARDEPEVIKLQDRMVSRASSKRVDRLQRTRRTRQTASRLPSRTARRRTGASSTKVIGARPAMLAFM